MRSTLASGSGIDVAVDCTKAMCGYSLAPTRMTFGSFSDDLVANHDEAREQGAVVLDLARAIGHVGRGVGVALGRLVAQRIAA